MKWFRKQKWMGAAALLGLTFFLAVLLVKPVGVSTQFSVLSGMIHSTVDPSVIAEDAQRESGYKSTNAYYDKSEGKLAANIKNPMNYDFIFVLAIPLGAYAAHLLRKKKNGSQITENQQCPIVRKSIWRRYLPPFIGGFILLYGARMADGCTSGHMMSGMMQGSVSGYLFAAAVFAAAIPTAILVHRKQS
ncbi:YeeE/YedE thiosulfate transporter family protein [Anaerolentibacter hominis]|uniref:YeeE/YedE thiosulfate transporter family protein n=1 Tax=Anaerolentibacter hominis TaxID=3079009 RepID=UPI0031B862F8